MENDALDHIIGGVRDGDDISAGLRTGALEKLIAKGARAGLDGAARHEALPAFDQDFDPQPLAEPADVVSDIARAWLQRVVVMSRDHLVSLAHHREQQGRAVRPPRHRDQDAIAERDQPGLSKPVYQCVRDVDPTICARMAEFIAVATTICA
jgi:hypothetical protein